MHTFGVTYCSMLNLFCLCKTTTVKTINTGNKYMDNMSLPRTTAFSLVSEIYFSCQFTIKYVSKKLLCS